MFLVNSESHKTLLDYKKEANGPRTNVRISEISLAKEKSIKFKPVYTSFSRFIIRLVLTDFEPYLENNFLDRAQNSNSSKVKDVKKLSHLKKLLKYSGPWVHHINSNSPQQFNQELAKVIKLFLLHITEQSKIFRIHSDERRKKSSLPLFSGLSSTSINQYLNDSFEQPANQASNNIQTNAKNTAKEDIKDLKISIPPSVSKDIDKLIKKIDKNP